MNRALTRGVRLLVIACLGLAFGCGGSNGSDALPRATLAEHLGFNDDRALRSALTIVSAMEAECQGEGPLTLPLGWNMSETAFIRQFGYGITTTGGQPFDADAIHLPCPSKDAIGALETVSSGMNDLAPELEEAAATVRGDPRTMDAVLDWSKCMTDAGFPYDDPDQVQLSFARRDHDVSSPKERAELQQEEIATAMVDQRCTARHLEPVVRVVRAEIETTILSGHTRLLERMRSASATLRRAAALHAPS